MIQTAKDYFLQQMLPTTSDIDRELWFRCDEDAQKFVEIMKSYSEEIVDECSRLSDQYDFEPWSDRIEFEKNIDRIKSKI